MDSELEPEEQLQPKVGYLHVQPWKDAQWEEVYVHLSKEHLLIRRRDLVYEDTMANNDIVDQKLITIRRDEESKLGIVIMGGLDYKCPVKIYNILEGSPAQQCGELHQHDIILKVNGKPMWGLSHDEAVDVIRQTHNEVTLLTGKLRLREIEDQIYVDEEWFVMTEIPLQMASVTRYQTGTSILRPNGFEVVSRDGKSKVCLRCGENADGEFDGWMGSITAFIAIYCKEEIEQYNNNLAENQQMVRMGWVYEQLPSTTHTLVWQRKFLALKGEEIQIHDSMPTTIAEWERPEKRYKLLEMTIKVLQPHTIPEQRANSFILTSGSGQSHIISCETKENVSKWTTAIHHTTVKAVKHIKRVRYSGIWKDRDVYFELDIKQGILLRSRTNLSNILWKKPFSFLQQSSDDGHSKLKLNCAIMKSKIADIQDIDLEELQLAICGLECFVAAKVSMLDSTFIEQHTDLVAY